MGFIRPELLGRPVADIEALCDDALTIVDEPGRFPEGLYYQARGVLHAISYRRGRTILIEGMPSPPRSTEDIRDIRAVMYRRPTTRREAHPRWSHRGNSSRTPSDLVE
jgi:hypothetical protein